MTISLEEVMLNPTPGRRTRIEDSAAIIPAEMSLEELRRAHKQAHARMAKDLKVSNESISRQEKRADLYISTLRHYIEAMGGSLSLVARFPDREPIELTGISTLERKPPKSVKAKAAKPRSASRK